MGLKDITIITISSHKKSYAFAMTYRAKWALSILVFTIIISFIMSIGSVYLLQNELINIRQVREDLLNQYEDISNQNIYLNQTIDMKNLELQEVAKLDDIFSSQNGTNPGINSEENNSTNSNHTKHTITERRRILQNIPSGPPLSVGSFYVSSHYGVRNHPILERTAFHRGIDLAVATNTPVIATADGVVESVSSTGSYGLRVTISHNLGFSTTYAHLNSYIVSVGQYVKKGELIAYSGNTGRSTGPHVHYEIRYLNKLLNPKYFVSWNISNYNIVFNNHESIRWNSLLNILMDPVPLGHQQLLTKVVN